MAQNMQVALLDEAATVALGRRLAPALTAGAVVFLEGDLGLGKTTLSRGIITALGHKGAVKSPTYTLVEPYDLSAVKVYHFDLYRLSDPEELELLGAREYFDEGSVCLVEWSIRGQGFLPKPDLQIELNVSDDGRIASLRAFSRRGESVLKQLGGEIAE